METHSKFSYSKEVNGYRNLRRVEDIYGNTVYSPKNLYSYLRWIQNRIVNERNKI